MKMSHDRAVVRACASGYPEIIHLDDKRLPVSDST
jgi:hypothetical protein